MKLSIENFFSKCDQTGRRLRIWSHLLKKSLMENIFCAVNYAEKTCRTLHCLSGSYKLLKDLMQSICYIADRFIKDTLEKVNTECL